MENFRGNRKTKRQPLGTKFTRLEETVEPYMAERYGVMTFVRRRNAAYAGAFRDVAHTIKPVCARSVCTLCPYGRESLVCE